MPDIMLIKELRDITKISDHAMSLQCEVESAIARFEKEVALGEAFLDSADALQALRKKHLGYIGNIG